MATIHDTSPLRRTRRTLLAVALGIASIGGLAACGDDTTDGDDPDGIPAPGGVSDENVPLPPDGTDVDTSDDHGEGAVDGERPGVGGESDTLDEGEVDPDGDGVTGDADEGDANTDGADTEDDE